MAWCSLLPSDDTPGRFWRAVAAALQAAGVTVAEHGRIDAAASRVHPAGRAATPPRSDEAVVAPVVEALGRGRGTVVLVLDGLERCRHPRVLAQVTLLLSHLPAGCSVLVGCRPPVRLPELRRLAGAGVVRRLDGASLWFTADEVARVVAAHGGRTHGVARVAETTAGWPALVHLALTAGPGAVHDYVHAEVLRGAPARAAPGPGAPPAPTSAAARDTLEPLTERETVVLRWLAGPLTLRDIGRELYVSRNTVKTHVAAVYRKLEVCDRRDAVTRGRALGILPVPGGAGGRPASSRSPAGSSGGGR